MTYRPILPRLFNAIAAHFGLTCARFPEHVDLIVRVGQDGQRNELLRVTVDIDANHKLCGTWPVADLNWPLRELHLDDEVEADRDNCA